MAEFINSVSEAIAPHRLLLATIGIPILTLIITAYISRQNTKLSASLKVCEMRQAWINNLRDHMVRYSALCLDHYKGRKRSLGDLADIDSQITLMMNQEDEDYEKLIKSMNDLDKKAMGFPEYDGKCIAELHQNYITICQGILKREWNRLKTDIKKKRV